MRKLSENFEQGEFACGCGCGRDDISQKLVDKLQILRDVCGKPITITSGVRCPDYNAHIGGVKTSPHMAGIAADLQIEGMSVPTTAIIASRIHDIRIGIYPKHLHIDIKPPNPSKYWIVKDGKYIYSGKETDLNTFMKNNL